MAVRLIIHSLCGLALKWKKKKKAMPIYISAVQKCRQRALILLRDFQCQTLVIYLRVVLRLYYHNAAPGEGIFLFSVNSVGPSLDICLRLSRNTFTLLHWDHCPKLIVFWRTIE